ncbi:hypothetical protein AAVH_33110 [Aphelenchoides avenae]|nr:hypothetical protein AAVH_33110 [Aphelenchus avenae]
MNSQECADVIATVFETYMSANSLSVEKALDRVLHKTIIQPLIRGERFPVFVRRQDSVFEGLAKPQNHDPSCDEQTSTSMDSGINFYSEDGALLDDASYSVPTTPKT